MFSAYVLYLVSFFALFLPSNKTCQALGQCTPMTTFLSEGYRHAFSSQLLPGSLHTVCSISTILPAVCKIMSDEIFIFFFKERLWLSFLNLHRAQESLPNAYNWNRLWPMEHFWKSPPRRQEGSKSHHNHMKKYQKHVSCLLPSSFQN